MKTVSCYPDAIFTKVPNPGALPKTYNCLFDHPKKTLFPFALTPSSPKFPIQAPCPKLIIFSKWKYFVWRLLPWRRLDQSSQSGRPAQNLPIRFDLPNEKLFPFALTPSSPKFPIQAPCPKPTIFFWCPKWKIVSSCPDAIFTKVHNPGALPNT